MSLVALKQLFQIKETPLFYCVKTVETAKLCTSFLFKDYTCEVHMH
jgi:hypothetical protein